MQKTSFFVAALFDRSFRASPSSLKQDVNNSIQSSNSLSANYTVAQSSGSEHLWRTMSLTVSSTPRVREDWFLFFFFFFFLLTYLSLLTKTEILSCRRRSRPSSSKKLRFIFILITIIIVIIISFSLFMYW